MLKRSPVIFKLLYLAYKVQLGFSTSPTVTIKSMDSVVSALMYSKPGKRKQDRQVCHSRVGLGSRLILILSSFETHQASALNLEIQIHSDSHAKEGESLAIHQTEFETPKNPLFETM